MSSRNNTYFTADNVDSQQGSSFKGAETSAEKESYFTPVNDEEPLATPESIQDKSVIQASKKYQFTQRATSKVNILKWSVIFAALLMVAMLSWNIYWTFRDIISFNQPLGIVFAGVVVVFCILIFMQIILYIKGQRQLSSAEKLRQQAEQLLSTRSVRKAGKFKKELRKLYVKTPQLQYLDKALAQQPDTLNDAEIISRLSRDFFSILDEEALRLINNESLKIVGMVSVSQLMALDTLIVIWKSMGMVNSINSIYGLRLTKIGQWRIFIKILKASLLGAGTQFTVNTIVDKAAIGLPGNLALSVSQGLVVGNYVAKIGIETMKHSRPIAFTENEEPDINLITDGIKNVFFKNMG